ncbi:MAG: tetratricopeptide repeat protein [Anaerolineales bacterium]|nr:tetratricopeptide repeat protein [Anaerolineales bacterium]
MQKQKSSTIHESVHESVHESISTSLLTLAMTLEKLGKVHQALPPYLKIIEKYPDTPEVPVAIEKVLAIAEGMRQKGQFHVAMRVYERLENASQEDHEK